jgi:hypothetical protein
VATKKVAKKKAKAPAKKPVPKSKKMVKMGPSRRHREGYGEWEQYGNPGAETYRRKKASDAIRRGNMDK